MSDVFVSYKRENLAAVGRLVEALRTEGIGVWWDQDIAPNAAWEATIEQALAAAKLVIVAWSPASVASENVKAEARWARTQGRLLQVFVEACEPPLFFGERQGVDLKAWSGAGSDPAFRSVLEAVRKGLEQQPAAPSSDDATVARVADASPPLPAKPSIAVMPFANLSGDLEQEYFADGMVAEITTALSRIRSIFVIASSSTLSFKGKAAGAQEVARQLGVRFVLEGSVRRAANRVRIAVQLIDGGDGAQLWADRFEDTLDDVFALQDKVALAVAGKIEPTVQEAEIRRASARPTGNMSSYDLYLRSLPLSLTVGKAGISQALDLVTRAIALDPEYASAVSQAAACHYLLDRYAWSDDPAAERRQAVEMAHRALLLDGDDPRILAVGALVASDLEHDQPTAVALLDKALVLGPSNAIVWGVSGAVWMRAGETDRALEHLEMSIRLDPMGSARLSQLSNTALVRFQQRRFADAVAFAKQFIQRTDAPGGYACLAASYGHLRQTDAAREALKGYRARSPQPIEVFARSIFHDPAHTKLFLDGIALAEGESSTGAAP